MRTTVTIDDHLLSAARALAAGTRRTLGEVARFPGLRWHRPLA